MKKFIISAIVIMNGITYNTNSKLPTYKIIANSNSENDIDQMYNIKNQLLEDYPLWVKGVDDTYQALEDHAQKYDATFSNGEFIIKLGKGNGKELTGRLQVSYCASSKDIKKKSWIQEFIFGE